MAGRRGDPRGGARARGRQQRAQSRVREERAQPAALHLPLLGRGECAIDAKRRLILPAVLRDQLRLLESSAHLIVTVGHQGCLLLIPPSTWEEFAPDLFTAAVQGDEGAIRLRGTMARYGLLCRIDNSGRITLTDEQMKVAGLAKRAIVFGNFSRIEIWNPERFELHVPRVADPAEHDRLTARYLGRAEAPGVDA